ncbi:hypothetical protein [Candidatus Amarolinea dominans]|nr:hypothetical protein [Anaerolineae bacterium]
MIAALACTAAPTSSLTMAAVLVMTWPLTSASACAWNVPVSVAPAAS